MGNVSESKRSPSAADPWLAVNYALVLPGLGQLYSRHWVKGWALVAIALGLVGYGVWAIFGAAGNTLHGLWAIAVLVVVYSFSILDAYRGTQPNYASRIAVPQGRLDPWYAVFLSQILPGLGHLYTQQAEVGGVILFAALAAVWLANQVPLFAPLPPLIWALGCYHVYQTFPKPRRRQPTAIALLVLGLFLLRVVLGNAPNWVSQTFEQCIVPTESMVPTLQVNDRLFVRRDRTYRPQTGDIVVFEPPPVLLTLSLPDGVPDLLVKRAIGLPGQRVAIANGQVFINDEPLSEDYLAAPPAYTWGPDIVPPNSYFMLGDNRNASSDSHIWGYVPAATVLGKAYKIYWPPERVRSLQAE
ncbi:MAG TPA: signal peptidase I [Candidatus Obscuribacterales bacterium]